MDTSDAFNVSHIPYRILTKRGKCGPPRSFAVKTMPPPLSHQIGILKSSTSWTHIAASVAAIYSVPNVKVCGISVLVLKTSKHFQADYAKGTARQAQHRVNHIQRTRALTTPVPGVLGPSGNTHACGRQSMLAIREANAY